jgi:hypothetical protein
MENNTANYQLAHTHHNYIKTQFQNRDLVNNSSILQPGSQFSTFQNIFGSDSGQKNFHKLDNIAQPNYQLVGAKEVRSYQQRL